MHAHTIACRLVNLHTRATYFAPAVVLCKAGVRSMQVCSYLQETMPHFKNLYNVEGGTMAFGALLASDA